MNELDDNGKRIFPLNILHDGSFVFMWWMDSCIYRLKPGQTDAECIADLRYGDDTYEYIRLRAVSPDGKWIAFTRGKKTTKQSDGFNRSHYDLFVKEIPE